MKRLLCPASLQSSLALYGDGELLKGHGALLGFGMKVTSGQRQIIKHTRHVQSELHRLKSQPKHTEAAAVLIPASLSSGTLLRDQLFAALKGKEEHTLFQQAGKVPWAC